MKLQSYRPKSVWTLEELRYGADSPRICEALANVARMYVARGEIMMLSIV